MHFQRGGNLSLVTLTFDLWPWHSNSSERGTKHVFCVNLAQIRWAVPEIFCTQTKKVTDSAKNRTLCSSLHAVKIRKRLWRRCECCSVMRLRWHGRVWICILALRRRRTSIFVEPICVRHCWPFHSQLTAWWGFMHTCFVLAYEYLTSAVHCVLL